MRLGLYIIAGCVAFVGLIFLIGHQGLPARLVIGIVLIIGALALAAMTRLKAPAPAVTIHQHIEPPGESSLEQLKCKNCDAPLDQTSVELREGAVFVKCPYCGTSYQVEEAPKW